MSENNMTNDTTNCAANDNAPRAPKRHYKLHIYKEDEMPFDAILSAVSDGTPQMLPGKKYTLKQIVELGKPGLWSKLDNYTRRCMGASFATMYYKLNVYPVIMVDPDQSPIRYLSE